MTIADLAGAVWKSIYPRRNKPRRSKSRWRKTLDKRHAWLDIVEAYPNSPLMKASAKDPADAGKLMEESMATLLSLGTVGIVPGALKLMGKL